MSDSTVLGVVVVARGGDRTYLPQFLYQIQPTIGSASGATGPPVLTPLGEQQEVQLGSLLRSIYLADASSSLIQGIGGNASVYNQTEVTVRADNNVPGGTFFDSAVALGQGLWPPTATENIQLANGSIVVSPLGGYQYVLVDPVNPTDDPTLNGVANCDAFWDRADQAVGSPPLSDMATEIAQWFQQITPFLPPGIQDFGSDDAIYDIGAVYDYLNVQTIHNASFAANLPSGSVQQARAYSDSVAYNLFTDASPTGLGNIAGRSIMGDIVTAIYSIADGTGLKMFVDVISFEPFLSLMNITGITESGNLPHTSVDYAAAMAFEVRSNTSGDVTIRVNFKNGTADDEFHTYGMIFGEWNGSGGLDVPLETFGATFLSVGIDTWSPWCTICQNNQTDACLITNLLNTAQTNTTFSSGQSVTSASVSPASDVLAHSSFNPVGAGFLGAGLAIVVLSAVFGFLLFLGVFSYGGVRKWRRFSNSSYRREKRRVGDELELRSETNSVVGLKAP